MKKNNKNNNHKILNKNYIKGAISGALALTILCSGVGVAAYSAGADNTAQALGVQTESTVEAVKKASTTKEALKKLSKNETVYVIADASGAAKKIIVSDWLKGVDTKGKVKDVSNLKDVKNVKGDETYTVNEDNAYEWAANGDDIYYQGTGTTELPVKLKLSYKLNGKTVSADEIAGKSGKVTIRIDYENTQKEKVKINGKTKEVNVPFLMLSGMILDDDKFKNVEVSNGKAINDGTRTIVAGFALPGMQDSLDIDKDEMEIPDYVEITADTTDFELSTTMTVAMNDIFNDVDFSKVDDNVDGLAQRYYDLVTRAHYSVDCLHDVLEVYYLLSDLKWECPFSQNDFIKYCKKVIDADLDKASELLSGPVFSADERRKRRALAEELERYARTELNKKMSSQLMISEGAEGLTGREIARLLNDAAERDVKVLVNASPRVIVESFCREDAANQEALRKFFVHLHNVWIPGGVPSADLVEWILEIKTALEETNVETKTGSMRRRLFLRNLEELESRFGYPVQK